MDLQDGEKIINGTELTTYTITFYDLCDLRDHGKANIVGEARIKGSVAASLWEIEGHRGRLVESNCHIETQADDNKFGTAEAYFPYWRAKTKDGFNGYFYEIPQER